MATTFQKRQKEMKRLEKQRMKAERRAQKKIINRAERESHLEPQESVLPEDAPPAPAGPEPQH
jgi:hypothetical protein